MQQINFDFKKMHLQMLSGSHAFFQISVAIRNFV